ncbi:MAG: hypothetical protein HQK58_02290 [Deltaproteobacteria bacterium]|nr:hypothetical protein [Deltaproteobacteria bacterium]
MIVCLNQTINKSELHKPVELLESAKLRRVTSFQTFWDNNLSPDAKEEKKRPRRRGSTEESHNSKDTCPDTASLLDGDLSGEIWADLLERLRVKRYIGPPWSATWWTFETSDLELVPPATGEDYMKELALSAREMDNGKNTAVIELEITVEGLDSKVYKPTALDGFCSNTLFKPELTDRPYGLTCTAETGIKFRPEVISASKRYRDLKTKQVRLTIISFMEKKKNEHTYQLC